MNESQELRTLVVRTAGINCDEEAVRAFEGAGSKVELLHLNALIAEPARLASAHILVVPGGFSYGDDVAAGRVFGVELRQHLFEEIQAFLAQGGYVLGICNGFQVLVELGLFEPGVPPEERSIALTDNASNRFEARWVTLRAEASAAAWLPAGQTYPCPVAHAEGRLVVRDDAAFRRLEERGQIALRYVSPGQVASGQADGPVAYPDNPNGSIGDVAGLTDPTGRVLGLMPHLERNLTPWNHPRWTRLPARDEGEGAAFFRSLVDAAAGRTLTHA
ncbi:MAG: phosphoribosylformylglycinamidine synthase I [Planctomycetota bacterium]